LSEARSGNRAYGLQMFGSTSSVVTRASAQGRAKVEDEDEAG
jgi:hypothetical protein